MIFDNQIYFNLEVKMQESTTVSPEPTWFITQGTSAAAVTSSIWPIVKFDTPMEMVSPDATNFSMACQTKVNKNKQKSINQFEL